MHLADWISRCSLSDISAYKLPQITPSSVCLAEYICFEQNLERRFYIDTALQNDASKLQSIVCHAVRFSVYQIECFLTKDKTTSDNQLVYIVSPFFYSKLFRISPSFLSSRAWYHWNDSLNFTGYWFDALRSGVESFAIDLPGECRSSGMIKLCVWWTFRLHFVPFFFCWWLVWTPNGNPIIHVRPFGLRRSADSASCQLNGLYRANSVWPMYCLLCTKFVLRIMSSMSNAGRIERACIRFMPKFNSLTIHLLLFLNPLSAGRNE